MFAYSKCTHAIKIFFSMSRREKTVEENKKLFLNVLPGMCQGENFKGSCCMSFSGGNGVQWLRLKLFRGHSLPHHPEP